MKRRCQIMCLSISFILLIAVFSGCTQNDKHYPVYSYKIEAERVSEFNLQKISAFEEMIPLETIPASVIGEIGKVFLTDSTILIWDSQENNILLFNRAGKYLRHIGRKGPSPEEYVTIMDVFWKEKEGRIMLCDPATQRLVEYDLNGICISSWQLKYYLYSFCPDIEGAWGINAQQNDKRYNLIYIDKKDNRISKGYLPGKEYLTYIKTNYFTINEQTNDTLFHFPYKDIIYRIKNKTLQPFLSIDFGKRKNTRDIYSKTFQNIESDGQIRNVHAYGDNLFFSFKCYPGGVMSIYHGYINFNDPTPVVYSINPLHSDSLKIQPLPDIVGLSQGQLIFQITPGIIPENILKKNFEGVFENINSESNPILVLYNLNIP